MSKTSEYRQAQISAFPEKTRKLSVEIARLMREGTPEGRKKAQELLQMAIEKHGAMQAATAQVKGDLS
ncbi:protein of unknown function [Acidithiobacillus ferrivorans]|uniref:Uncharacterized protein n=1 Tax=Acidithiobacillus ferrivorans TaxID=160808 RepID=A0A060UQI5_9PROT|nr:hypothetical protein [Acidithiobacillus ferrivorans]CDQ10506.1 hypothetical protein AFERRI_400287 [Acidithiobacillus ferrivorans]SMH64536.1 protein of unknown function [Acidithiobacillus ferrivorans]